MDTARFLIEVQRLAGQPADVRDPLAVTRTFISTCPTSQEAQVLRRLIRALVSGRGMFGRDDLEARSAWPSSRGVFACPPKACSAASRAGASAKRSSATCAKAR